MRREVVQVTGMAGTGEAVDEGFRRFLAGGRRLAGRSGSGY